MKKKIAGLIAACLTAAVLTPTTAEASSGAAARPNVLLIYVDDARADDIKYMDYTRTLFEQNGTVFSNAISPHPLCCPARAELMTGQYAQNNGVAHNDGQWGGYDALVRTDASRLTPQWFNNDGYKTAYVGKYLNGYNGGNIAGTDVTETLARTVYDPYDYTTWNNGELTQRNKHQTLWTSDRTQTLIGGFARPWMVTNAYLAPHSMKKGVNWVPPYRVRAGTSLADFPVPPRQYKTVEPGDDVPQSFADPSYRGSAADREEYIALHKARVLSLYAVDDSIRETVNYLKANGEFANTIIAFTSDNGYMLGEQGIDGKDAPYNASLRVPMMVMGPGVPVGTNPNVVTTVDLPRTLAVLAGVTPNRLQDGINMFAATPDRAVLIQSGSQVERFDWRGVYTNRYTYLSRNGAVEAYDHRSDPYELNSTPNMPDAAALGALLDRIKWCAGAACRTTFQDTP